MNTQNKEQLDGIIEAIDALKQRADDAEAKLAISEARCDGLTIQRDTKDRQNTELKQRVAKTEMERSFCEENAFRLQAQLSAKEKERARLQSELYDCNNALTEALSKLPAPTLRQEFEEWANKSGFDVRRDDLNVYASGLTHIAWLAYQARAGKEQA